MINLIVNGKPFTAFVDASCVVSIASVCNDFSFTATAVSLFPPFKIKDTVEVWVDGVKQLTGAIDEISGADAEGSHTIRYSGRDRTGDLVDSQLVAFDDIGGDITLKKVLEAVIKNIGSNLGVEDLLKPEPFNPAEDVIEDEDGTNALDMIIEYARKRQAIISSNAEGDVCIETIEPTDSNATLQRVLNGENNMISQSWEIRDSALFHRYIYKGQISPRSVNIAGVDDLKTVENQTGIVVDDSVRPGRQFVVTEENSYSSAQLLNRARWSQQIARSKATTFNCSVKGHSKYNGGLWKANTLVLINSDVADIHRKMLIETVEFVEGEGQPTLTNLTLVERDVYTIKEPTSKPIGSQGDAFRP